MLARARGLVTDAQPFNGTSFAAHAKPSGGMGDSFTIGAAGAPGLMQATASFSVHTLLSGVAQVAGFVDPAISGNAEVYLSWTARMVVQTAQHDAVAGQDQAAEELPHGIALQINLQAAAGASIPCEIMLPDSPPPTVNTGAYS